MKEGPPSPRLERARIPLRALAVVAGYLFYRRLEPDGLVGAGFAATGAVLVAWTAIDRWTLRRRERMELLQTATAILGLGLLGLGVYLLAR